MKGIKILIIDDERSARDELKRMLQSFPEMIIAGEAANAEEARIAIAKLQPDLLFLDIQMPGETGFELLESLSALPMVIFVTAFDEYAIKAFEVSAIDYLMKPIRDERFLKAIEQVRNRHTAKPDPQVFVKDGGTFHLVKWSDVHMVESLDNYARICFGDKKVLLKTSLNQLEEKLDSSTFFRANRAQLINLDFVEMIRNKKGQVLVTLKNNIEIEVSGRQAVKLKNRTKHLF
jgi:two-component system LytT family response regulator